MTLPCTKSIVRRPMLVLPVRVTNRCECSIPYTSSATCSLLLPMYASERKRDIEKDGETEKKKQINTFSLSFAHIYVSLPYAYASSLSDAFWERASSEFSQLYKEFFLARSLFLIEFSSIYTPNVLTSSLLQI